MEINNAIDQISEIHKHITKTEIFRGYRPVTIFSIGVIALFFAFFQFVFFNQISNMTFIIQWVILAFLVHTIILTGIIYIYFVHGNNLEKHQTVKILIQFVPSIMAGVLVTALLILYGGELLKFLPGLWAILFGLGIFSMCPYLPKFIFLVGIYYLISGGILLYLVKFNLSLSPWCMGITFGMGHFLASIILQQYIKRDERAGNLNE